MKYETIFTAPNGVGVVIDTEYSGKNRPFLRVISPCCGEEIHWDMSKGTSSTLSWNCADCNNLIAITPGHWASVFNLDQGVGDRWTCAEWLAEWFGVPADQVTVVISS